MRAFAVRYEQFCRVVLIVLVVNAAMVAFTLRGLVVSGALPSVSAAYATLRTWFLETDRSWSIRRTWRTFGHAWRVDRRGANAVGWPLVLLWVLIAVDHRILQQVTVDGVGLAASGLLLAVSAFLLLFTLVIWMVRAHFDEPLWWQVRATVTMVVARPLCSLMLLAVAFCLLYAVVAWPALVVVAGAATPIFAVCAVVVAFGGLPVMESTQAPRGAGE